MVKLQYTYRGEPITPYRPQRSKGPGKVATVLVVVLLVCGLLYGAWELYKSMTTGEEQINSVATQSQNQANTQNAADSNQTFDEIVQDNKIATARNTELSKEMVEFKNEITKLLNSNRLEEAREKLQGYLETYAPSHSYYGSAQKNLAYCTGKMIKSGKINKTQTHVVKSGENLTLIAKKYGVTTNAIIRASRLKRPDNLRINQELSIPVQAKWIGIVYKNKKRLFLYQDRKLIWVFTVTGIPNNGTPFKFDHNNQAIWTACGLSDNDWTILKTIVPTQANMSVGCK